MAKAPKMVIVALVLSLLALPAFGVRGDGLEGISFSSQPLNPLDHRAAGLIEDECSKALHSLEKTFTETCERHDPGATQGQCHTQAKDTIEHSHRCPWQDHLASKVIDDGKTPVFWAGFHPKGKKGIDTREALADFVSSVNGFQLADTEWGQVAESKGANNLENCPWDRKKNWWNVASIMVAKSMALHKVRKIIIALHKTFQGDYSFYRTTLYMAELVFMGIQMRQKSTWNPEFEVHSIPVKGAPPGESGCALAPKVKSHLEVHAERSVTVWCRPCTTLQACGPKQHVEKKSPKATCTGNCQNGQGTYTWANGDAYQGEWKNGLQDGQGTYTWADGEYQGGYKKNLREGQGTFTLANGDMYQGEFKDDRKDGQGNFTFANGDKYQGGWKNDLQDDQGTFTFANGNKYEVWYKEGNLTKKVKKK